MKIDQALNQVTQDFSSLSSWEEKYQKIISLGRELEVYPEEFRTDDYKVKGCQSQVWLYAKLTADKKIHYYADSDALIVKGLAAVLLKVYSDQSPKDILATPPHFLEEIGLARQLTPSRANGLNSMTKQIQYYALAFASLLK